MKANDILNEMDLGASVAEFDKDLEKYFVETSTFRSVVDDKADIIAGDKGTGKTAIYRVLKKNYHSYKQLESVEIVDAFNLQGSPVFQRLTAGPLLTEGQYRTVWKAYIFSLVGNWVVNTYTPVFNNEVTDLKNTLDYLGLSTTDVTPASVFGNLWGLIKRLSNPSAVQTELSLTETGMPVVTPRVEFGPEKEEGSEIYNDDFLQVLDKAVKSTDLTIWVLFDRLDEAFTGATDVEIPALRALMRTYLDLADMGSVKLKLFVRKDLFRRIISGGFVNLTHINSRRIDIVWDDDDLIGLICRRLKQKSTFSNLVGEEITDDQLVSIIFPKQVDAGSKKPSSRTWILSRIRDGNNSKPPRNIIDLMLKAQETQSRREGRMPRDINAKVGPIIESESLKKAFVQLSETRVEDTLLAEVTDLKDVILLFRDGKSEHNLSTLNDLLSNKGDAASIIKALVDIGFLEELGASYKVPMLYRDGLKMTRGKAF